MSSKFEKFILFLKSYDTFKKSQAVYILEKKLHWKKIILLVNGNVYLILLK